MNKIAFGDNFRERDVGCQREIVKSLAEGRLPGAWGACQDIIGYWADAKAYRGILQHCRASMSIVKEKIKL